jgi:hypothetical protein
VAPYPLRLSRRRGREFRSGVALVLDQDRDAPVGGIEEIRLDAQQLVSVTTHLRHLVCTDTILLQQTPRRIGAIGPELPIAVREGVGIGRGVGTLDLPGQLFEILPPARSPPLDFALG